MTEQQARAYLSLIDVETATVNDLARASRVPRAKLYEVLEGLSRKGLLETIPETPQRFRANPLTALYETRAEELRSEEQMLKREIGELMLQLLPSQKDAAPDGDRDFMHISRGRTVVVGAARQLLERTQKSLVIFGDKLVLARFRIHADLYEKVARFASRGELRILVPEDAVTSIEGRRVHVDEILDHVRIVPVRGGDATLWVRDDAELLEAHFVPNDLHPSRGTDRLILNRDPEFAGAQSRILRSVWATGTPIKSGLAARR